MSEQFVNRIAPIANLDLVAVVMEKLVNRQDGLPGFAVYYGPSGWGKTTATVAVANRSRAYYVQMRSAWNRKTLLEKFSSRWASNLLGPSLICWTRSPNNWRPAVAR